MPHLAVGRVVIRIFVDSTIGVYIGHGYAAPVLSNGTMVRKGVCLEGTSSI